MNCSRFTFIQFYQLPGSRLHSNFMVGLEFHKACLDVFLVVKNVALPKLEIYFTSLSAYTENSLISTEM